MDNKAMRKLMCKTFDLIYAAVEDRNEKVLITLISKKVEDQKAAAAIITALMTVLSMYFTNDLEQFIWVVNALYKNGKDKAVKAFFQDKWAMESLEDSNLGSSLLQGKVG